MGVTLKTLAKYTGFSIATISRVLNNDPTMTVGEDTRRIIFDTAQKLGYAGGSGRRTQRIVSDTMTIGIVEMMSPAEQITDLYFLYLKNFVEHVCYEKKIQVVTLRPHADGYHAMASTDIDGIIAIGYFSPAQIESMQRITTNITFLDSSPNDLLFDSVVINFDLGIHQALDYLRGLGHRNIGFVGPRRLDDSVQDVVYEPRRKYFEHYMRESGLYRRELVVEAPLRDRMQAEHELRLCLSALEPKDYPTAIVTVNEECAIGAVHALKSMNLHIPKDISIVSFNNTVMSSVVEPPLTSISPHLDYMAATAVRLVRERASTPAHQPERKYPQRVVIPPALVKRSSTTVCK